ncbi:Protein CBG27212 [Caenorhabditis briggsae]|uniref:Protein CBG27212 n=1 Tax=Caenorhabditis briggsae TaxID=6238 RepID=B6IIA5_CAEBR|nr:Protein CBG27212 [Caenorhabditis briggsae]CAR99635.1 Protein CBG27212 [Caenorhabditis briggsae]
MRTRRRSTSKNNDQKSKRKKEKTRFRDGLERVCDCWHGRLERE